MRALGRVNNPSILVVPTFCSWTAELGSAFRGAGRFTWRWKSCSLRYHCSILVMWKAWAAKDSGHQIMQISVILAHPDPRSFNHAIAQATVGELLKNGHQIVFHDLYLDRFDPILLADEIASNAHLSKEIDLHCQEISRAAGIVIVHPNWWGQPPAILKGWVDRVIRVGIAYRFVEGDPGEGIPVGLLKAKAVLVFNTSNTPADREAGVFGDPLEALWKSCIFGLCGVGTFYRETFSVVVTSTPDQRREWLKRVREVVRQYFPESDASSARGG